MSGRDRLLAALSPELVAALEELVDDRVRERLEAGGANGNGSASPWLSLDEAADYLRVSPRTLERQLARGRIRSTSLGRRRLLHRDDLDELAKAATREDVPRNAGRLRSAWAGLRVGELRGLRWEDVDLEANLLRVRRSMLPDGTAKAPKSAAGLRNVPLLPALRRLLVAWKVKAPHSQPSDLVIGTADGKPIAERNMRRALEAAKAAAELESGEERLSWHSLRHSFASMLATDPELPATTLAQLVGHADAGFTLKAYARDAREPAAIAKDVLARASGAGVGG